MESIDPERILRGIPANAGSALPPVESWNPSHCVDLDIRISRAGDWYYQGSPMKRQELVRLFSTILKREGDDYFLVTPVEKVRIQVDLAPFVIVAMSREAEGLAQRLTLTTNVGDVFVLDEQHPLRVETVADSDEPRPLVKVRSQLEALVGRNVFYEMANLAETRELNGQTQMGVWSGGQFFALGAV